MTPIENATQLLEVIRALEWQVARLNAEAEDEIATIRLKYAPKVTAAKDRLKERSKELMTLCETEDPVLFGSDDTVTLANGALLKQEITRVVKKRDMLERVDKAGRKDLVKVARSVDWGEVDKLSDVELIDLGTERKRETKYGYDLKEE